MDLLLGLRREERMRMVPTTFVKELDASELQGFQEDLIEFIKRIIAYFRAIFGGDEPEDDLTDTSVPYGVRVCGAPRMWSQGFTGEGVVVGVIDTGITNHPDLVNNVVFRKDYVGGGSFNEHGTHVAGTVAANGQIKGVAYEAKLHDYRVLDSRGTGSNEDIATAIRDAANQGCHIINLSLGGRLGNSSLREAVQYAASKNVIIIAAAGNEGDGINFTPEYSYPAMYEECCSVGSANRTDTETAPSSFTNSNDQVDCCCQGENVLSTGPDNNYLVLSGTSMAAPHVAGMCALLIQRAISTSGSYKRDEILAELDGYAHDIYISGPDNTTGSGFVTFNSSLST
jgi:major intracellular serine protease